MIATCNFLVSNDPGPTNMAEAPDVTILTLYGNTNPRILSAGIGPFGRRHIVLSKSDLQAITVDEIVAVVRELLSRQ